MPIATKIMTTFYILGALAIIIVLLLAIYNKKQG
jgi:hypothetical protein